MSSVDYDAAARLALIIEAELGVALVNSKRSARKVEDADELLLAMESEGGVEVNGSSEGEVPCASPSDYMNLVEGSRVLVNYKGKLYKATIRKHRVKFGKQEFQIHYDGNKKTTVKWIPVDCIKSSEVASDEDTYDHSSSSSKTKNTNKRKRAQRSLTPNGQRRRNLVRSSRSDLSADKPTDQPSACQASVFINENLALGESVGFHKGLAVGESVGFHKGLAVGESVGFDENLAVGESADWARIDGFGFDQGIAVGEGLAVDEDDEDDDDDDDDTSDIYEHSSSSSSNRKVDEHTDVVLDPSYSDNSSDDESTDDVLSISAYDQVENEDKIHEDEDDDDDDDDDDSNVPVATKLRLKDIMFGVHWSMYKSHPGNMRASELAKLNYKEYCIASSNLVKQKLVAKLVQSLHFEGRRFLMKTRNGWMTMSDEQTHFRYSKMIKNKNTGWEGREKVKPIKSAVTVKLNKSTWNEDDCKTLREYVSENDEEDVCMWSRIAIKLNRTESACKKRMRIILDCGIYGEEKKGELIVFLYYFNFMINCLILCYAP